jgi:hypothetical protein
VRLRLLQRRLTIYLTSRLLLCLAVGGWQRLTRARFPGMLVGYAGCGKTQLMSSLLLKQREDPTVGSVTINFNYYTNSSLLQSTLEAPLDKRSGSTYGPAGAHSRILFFLDDLNLPEVDKYNTQSAIALLRQHIDYGHWYDRTKLMLKTIQDTQYVAAMNPSVGSFLINPRLQVRQPASPLCCVLAPCCPMLFFPPREKKSCSLVYSVPACVLLVRPSAQCGCLLIVSKRGIPDALSNANVHCRSSLCP